MNSTKLRFEGCGSKPVCLLRKVDAPSPERSVLSLFASPYRVGLIKLIIRLSLVAAITCTPANAAAASYNGSSTAFTRSIYAGVGLGFSLLEPDTSVADGWDINDRTNSGGQVNLGFDITKQLSIELHSADLGSAGLSPGGRINYHTTGISGLFYIGAARHRYLRRGLSAYARLGVGRLENSPVGAVPFENINSTHQLTGAGLEYAMRNGFGVRAEFISFDRDVRYAQIALIYRPGKRYSVRHAAAKSKPVIAAARRVTVDDPPPQQAEVPQVTLAIATTTPVVQTNQCKTLDGSLGLVNFHTDSATLTSAATRILDGVATVLAGCRDVPVTIAAHTDSVGADDYNRALSQRRALSVINHLTDSGIDRSRLYAATWGESRPVDTNDTVAGRKRNRRVEVQPK